MGRGKSKGNAYERKVAKDLSLWWSNGKQDDVFYKTHGSGNRGTVRSKQGKTTSGQYGDICAVDSRGKSLTAVCVISIKKGYNTQTPIDLLDLNTQGKDSYAGWIKDAIRDKNNSGVPGWILIHGRDRRNPMISISSELYWLFEEQKLFSVVFQNKPHLKCRIKLQEQHRVEKFFVYRLSDFLKHIGKEQFKQLHMRLEYAQKTRSPKLSKSKKASNKVRQVRNRSSRPKRQREDGHTAFIEVG